MICVDRDGRVHAAHEEGLRHDKQLAREDDDARRAVAHLLVLAARQLEHVLGSRVRHVDLAQDGVAVVRDDDAAHRVEEHLQHALGAERRAHDIGHSLGGRDVGELGLASALALRVRVLWRARAAERGGARRARRAIACGSVSAQRFRALQFGGGRRARTSTRTGVWPCILTGAELACGDLRELRSWRAQSAPATCVSIRRSGRTSTEATPPLLPAPRSFSRAFGRGRAATSASTSTSASTTAQGWPRLPRPAPGAQAMTT